MSEQWPRFSEAGLSVSDGDVEPFGREIPARAREEKAILAGTMLTTRLVVTRDAVALSIAPLLPGGAVAARGAVHSGLYGDDRDP